MKMIDDERTGYLHLAMHLLLGGASILFARCIPLLEPRQRNFLLKLQARLRI